MECIMSKVAKWLRKSIKQKARKEEKLAKKKDKLKVYIRGELSFPIYVFSNGERVSKIKSLEAIRRDGLDLGCILLSVREGTPAVGLVYSYNKKLRR